MKHIFSLIFIAFAITAHAQQQAEIEVSYTEYQPNMRTGQKDGTSSIYIACQGRLLKILFTTNRISRLT